MQLPRPCNLAYVPALRENASVKPLRIGPECRSTPENEFVQQAASASLFISRESAGATPGSRSAAHAGRWIIKRQRTNHITSFQAVGTGKLNYLPTQASAKQQHPGTLADWALQVVSEGLSFSDCFS